MDISPTLTGPLTSSIENSSTNSAISSDFETFLKMLTAQMQNQDPLDPIKSEDYAVQLATFSGVEQQVRTNDLITAMTAQLSLMGMSQMAGWVGMEARAPVAGYFDGDPITLAPNPPITAARTELVVRDSNGIIVQRMEIPVSADPVEWSGMTDSGLPFGTGLYEFQVESFAGEELIATTPVEVYSTIVEARSEGGQTILVTRGGSAVPASLVTALRDPALPS